MTAEPKEPSQSAMDEATNIIGEWYLHAEIENGYITEKSGAVLRDAFATTGGEAGADQSS